MLAEGLGCEVISYEAKHDFILANQPIELYRLVRQNEVVFCLVGDDFTTQTFGKHIDALESR